MLKATVSGSFHRHMVPIYDAVGSLREAGVDVLSPSDPRVVDHIGDFLFVASDKLRSIKLVQDRHLQAIRASDFLWVVCPDGYTGASTSMEVGAAFVADVPVFSSSPVLDSTISAYVKIIPNIKYAITATSGNSLRRRAASHILIDPIASIENSHVALDRLRPFLIDGTGDRKLDAELEIARAARIVRTSFDGIPE